MKDVIFYKPGDLVENQNQVVKVERAGGNFGVDLSNGLEDVFMMDLYPIQLNESILKDLGFEYSDFYKYFFIGGIGGDKIQYSLENKVLICKSTMNHKNIYCKREKCNYLHELCRTLNACEMEEELYRIYDYYKI